MLHLFMAYNILFMVIFGALFFGVLAYTKSKNIMMNFNFYALFAYTETIAAVSLISVSLVSILNRLF